MTDNCLDVKAQFRYLDSQLLQQIEEEGTLVSVSTASFKGRWSVLVGKLRNNRRNAKFRLKQTATGSLFLYNKTNRACAEPSSDHVSGTPYCNETQQKFTFGK